MISVVVSKDARGGDATIEKVYEWAQPEELASQEDGLRQLVGELRQRYGPSREVFTASARSLQSFYQAYPEYVP